MTLSRNVFYTQTNELKSNPVYEQEILNLSANSYPTYSELNGPSYLDANPRNYLFSFKTPKKHRYMVMTHDNDEIQQEKIIYERNGIGY